MTVRMEFERSGGDVEIPAAGKLAADAFYASDDFHSTVTSNSNVGGGGTNNYALASAINAGSPGVVIQTATAVADRATLLPATGQVTAILFGGGEITFVHRSRTTTAQDGVDQYSDRCGMGDSATADFTEGVYFEADRAVHGDNFVRLCAADNGVRTKNSLGVAFVPGAWERWKFIVNAAGTSVQAYLNDVAVGAPVTTNIPVAASRVTGVWCLQIIKTLGAAQRRVDRDYVEAYQVYSGAR